MDTKFGFSMIGLIVFMAPMLVNILYFVLPQTNPPEDKKQPVWDQIEGASRMLYAVALCILVPTKEVDFHSFYFCGMIIFGGLYSIVWMRYFIGGKEIALLGSNFLFVPIPLAIFPVAYYLLGALWLKNYVALSCMIVFGISHIVISYRNLYVEKQQ